MHLGIVKITYNRTAQPWCYHNDRFVNLGEEVILTLLWQSGASESVTVISLSICYWLFKSIVCVCVCVCSRVWERETRSHHNHGLFANTYEHHHCVCHVTLFSSRAWTDGKTKDIINCLYIHFESWSLRLWKGALHFRKMLAVFGQSQCTVPVGQSEQTALVGRRDFVESVWERRGIEDLNVQYLKNNVFWTLNHDNIFCYTKFTK